MNKDTNIIMRVDSALKDSFTEVASANGYNLSELITAFMRDISRKKKIPINLIPYLPLKQVDPRITIVLIKNCLEEIIKKYDKGLVRKAYLFGSFAGGEEKDTSDIDIRIEADSGLSIRELALIKGDLEKAFNREVDLICMDKKDMDALFYASLKKDEVCLYER